MVKDVCSRAGRVGFAMAMAVVPACIGEDTLLVTGLEVCDEDDGNELEMEVHLFDADSGQPLGCAGRRSGLVSVNESDARYSLQARFHRATSPPQGGDGEAAWIRGADLTDRALIFVVIEDDAVACPELYGGSDDIVGVSPVISFADLASPVSFHFDRVTALVLEIR